MITLNFFKTFYYELIDFLNDIKNFITYLLSNIHNFLNKFMPDEVILLFLIGISAFILTLIFRIIINKR